MPRIPRVPSLQPLQRGICSSRASRIPFAARALSTTSPAHAPSASDRIRSKLWKGEAPGPEDPYTQRSEPEEWTPPAEAYQRPAVAATERAAGSLVLPPKRSEATPENELASVDPTYAPASTMEELEQIAPLKKWWEQPGHWTEESLFSGFGRTEKVVEKDIVEVYVRRALVEALVLKEAGKFPKWATKRWRVGEREQLDNALALEIEVVDGQASLKGDVKPVVHSLLAKVSNKAPAESVEMVSVDEAREMIRTWGREWKEMALTDELKFSLRKRLFQLTGNLIPDSRLGASRTVKHIITLGSKQPPAKKLVDVLERGDLPQLSNVTVHERKIGMIDKEVAVGRWKVIEEELKKRDLPVRGTAGLPRKIEQKWMRAGF